MDAAPYVEACSRRWAERARRLGMERKQAVEKAGEVARMLRRDFGCTSVVLIGSCVGPRSFREDSDIDLVISGLPAEQLWRARARAQEIAGRRVDLIPREDACEHILDVAARTGMELS